MKLVDGTLLETDLRDAGNYLTDHPKDSDLVKRNVNRMCSDYTALQMKIASSILVQQAEQASLRVLAVATAAPRALATITAEYTLRTEPLAALFQQLVKQVEKGNAPVDDSASMFDPLSGKPLILFAKATRKSLRARTSSTRSTSWLFSGRA